MAHSPADVEDLRPAGSKRSSKREFILNVFLRHEGHLSADDLVELIRREDSPHQPRHRLPRPAVDGRGGHRPQGRFRRRPFPLRTLLPSPAPLPPDLPDLQPLVGVPQLGHRGAPRGDRRRAEFLRASERVADLRDLRGVPDRPAAGERRRHDRAAVRARRHAHRDRHRAQRPRVLLARGPCGARCARAHGVPQAGGGRARAPGYARGALPASHRPGCDARVAADLPLLQGGGATGSSRPAPSRWPAAWTTSRRS